MRLLDAGVRKLCRWPLLALCSAFRQAISVTADAAELHRQARALLRPDVYDYYAGGSGREDTLRANEKAWRRVRLRPRIFRNVSAVDTSVEAPGWAGGRLRTPLAVAPTAFHRLAHPDGEIATATGAARAGALYVMSTRSSRRIEDVAAASADAGGTWWFQVYLMRDGRPVLLALACGGADGVQSLLEGLTNDLAHVMALAGAACLADLAGLADSAFPAGPAPKAAPSLPGAQPRHNVES
jgi:isopentenyl diphosphate isomerase/L-lactate dehydrogenase-like FMN-dependent dehydrogenase